MSSAAYSAASAMACWISASDRLELEEITISWARPVPRSRAETFRMPLASRSKRHLDLGHPSGGRLMPVSRNFPMLLLSLRHGPLALKHNFYRISTVVWKLAAVLKIWE